MPAARHGPADRNSMAEPVRPEPRRTPTDGSTPAAGHKLLALLGTAAIPGGAVYLSADPAPVAATPAGLEQEAANPTARAVTAATTFLDGLDATQRGQATLDYGSPKKPNWSNLPVTFVPRN